MIAGSVFMLSTAGSFRAVNSQKTLQWPRCGVLLKICHSLRRKWKEKTKSETQTGADLVCRDDGGGTEAVDSVVKEVEPELEHVNRALDDQEAAVAIGRAEENVDMHVVDTACHSPSDDSNSGVEDADTYSNTDERQVDSFLVNGLN